MDSANFSSDELEKLIDERVKQELKAVLDCIQDGIFITDGDGTILMLNKASVNFCPYTEEELVGRNMRDLVKEHMFDDALSIQAIETGRKVSAIQKGVTHKYDLLVTAVPCFKGNEITRVILTERDITELNQLKATLEKNIEINRRYEEEMDYYREQNLLQGKLIYKSRSMNELVSSISKIAPIDATVLIQGESGTGKSLIAKLIHENSHRKKGPFMEINCGAIPENLLESELFGYEKGAFTGATEKGKIGLFELASGGTLFLDEIGAMPLHLQIKVLRAIQEKEVMRIGGNKYIPIDIRIISATNTNLIEAVNAGTFRKDLFYRLNVLPLNIVPLRERREDIICLCEHFLKELNKKYNTSKSLAASAWKLLCEYDWPGNVRELENILERMVVITNEDIITGELISSILPELHLERIKCENYTAIDLKTELEKAERNLIQERISCSRNMDQLAQSLNVSKTTLARKMKKYDLQMK